MRLTSAPLRTAGIRLHKDGTKHHHSPIDVLSYCSGRNLRSLQRQSRGCLHPGAGDRYPYEWRAFCTHSTSTHTNTSTNSDSGFNSNYHSHRSACPNPVNAGAVRRGNSVGQPVERGRFRYATCNENGYRGA